ncbi:DUF3515 family protein [Streptosporangium sp. NPDC005286]|uniref:DUF3515 family protein n=1 Tax=Streptosporangium sp. NPDC005286 TaxID=3154463 RepID=UPI0033A9F22B
MPLRFIRLAGCACALLILAGCGGAVRVEPPVPEGPAAAACQALAERLPRRLDGADRVESTPASPYVAVWGQGRIALRCGVPRPVTMSPTDQVPEINEVAWYADPARPTLFTSIGRAAYVEVTVAREHTPQSVLVDLAAPIKAALPQTG